MKRLGNAVVLLPKDADQVRKYGPGDIGISSITLAELEFGISKSAKPEKNRRILQEFLLPFDIVAFTRSSAMPTRAFEKQERPRL